MRYVSLFSGIEAASVAWGPLGFEPVAFAEVEPFCCDLLEKRFPEVPNLGDVTEIDWSDYRGAVDVVVGGSPCQAFSLAGNRGGLADERGRLMFEYVRAVREIRPRWIVWENVPGALSSEGGEAFRCLLRELDGLGYGLAGRVLDAQFFGVAQRRRRLFLVGHHGDPRPAAEVLFEPEGLRWDLASSKQKREELSEDADIRTREGRALKHLALPQQMRCFQQNQRNELRFIAEKGDIAGAITATAGMKNQNYVVAFNPRNGHVDIELSGTIQKGGNSYSVNAQNPVIGPDGTVRRLTPTECERLQGFPDGWTDIYPDKVRTLTEEDWTGAPDPFDDLQAFKEYVPVKRKAKVVGTPDAPRYKALGNSMAVPVMEWIGRRIQEECGE